MTQQDPQSVRPGAIAPPNSPAQLTSSFPTLEHSNKMPAFEYQKNLTWQEKLQVKCRELRINPPVYITFSDRRGGRTAWSSKVTVSGRPIAARFWYDGEYLNNAMEDAAEMALMFFNPPQGRFRY